MLPSIRQPVADEPTNESPADACRRYIREFRRSRRSARPVLSMPPICGGAPDDESVESPSGFSDVGSVATLRPANEIDDKGRSYARDILRRQLDILQSLRKARYFATIEAGKGKGTVDRDSLRAERIESGVTIEKVCAARNRTLDLEQEAERLGFVGRDVVDQARREAREELRTERLAHGPFLSRGKGYYPGPGERIRSLVAVNRADHEARERFARQLPPAERRSLRPNYCRLDLPESRSTIEGPSAYRAAAANRLRAERIARHEAKSRAKARAEMIASLIARGKQTPERVDMAQKIRKFRSAVWLNCNMFGPAKNLFAARTTRERYREVEGGTARHKRRKAMSTAVVIDPPPGFSDTDAEPFRLNADPVKPELAGKASDRAYRAILANRHPTPGENEKCSRLFERISHAAYLIEHTQSCTRKTRSEADLDARLALYESRIEALEDWTEATDPIIREWDRIARFAAEPTPFPGFPIEPKRPKPTTRFVRPLLKPEVGPAKPKIEYSKPSTYSGRKRITATASGVGRRDIEQSAKGSKEYDIVRREYDFSPANPHGRYIQEVQQQHPNLREAKKAFEAAVTEKYSRTPAVRTEDLTEPTYRSFRLSPTPDPEPTDPDPTPSQDFREPEPTATVTIEPGQSTNGADGWLILVTTPDGRTPIREWDATREGADAYASFARHMIEQGRTPRAIEHGSTWDAAERPTVASATTDHEPHHGPASGLPEPVPCCPAGEPVPCVGCQADLAPLPGFSGRPATDHASLALTIDGTDYGLTVSADRETFTIERRDGKAYEVANGSRGLTCTCADFIHRRAGLDPSGCKHCRAIRTAGLISAVDEMPARLPSDDVRPPSGVFGKGPPTVKPTLADRIADTLNPDLPWTIRSDDIETIIMSLARDPKAWMAFSDRVDDLAYKIECGEIPAEPASVPGCFAGD